MFPGRPMYVWSISTGGSEISKCHSKALSWTDKRPWRPMELLIYWLIDWLMKKFQTEIFNAGSNSLPPRKSPFFCADSCVVQIPELLHSDALKLAVIDTKKHTATFRMVLLPFLLSIVHLWARKWNGWWLALYVCGVQCTGQSNWSGWRGKTPNVETSYGLDINRRAMTEPT